jgi:hypothetical protein
MSLTQKRLKELLMYDPATGIFRWRVRCSGRDTIDSVAGYTNSDGYWKIDIDYRGYNASRLAWFYVTGRWPKDQIDHINTNRLDNRFENLRQASRNENARNRNVSKNKKSRLPKGVYYNGKYYQAGIRVNGKQLYLGTFRTLALAVIAYAEAAKKLHGKFARTN